MADERRGRAKPAYKNSNYREYYTTTPFQLPCPASPASGCHALVTESIGRSRAGSSRSRAEHKIMHTALRELQAHVEGDPAGR